MPGYRRPHSGCIAPQRGEVRPTMLRSVNYGSTQSCAGGRVAVMPSVGRRKKLLVLGVTATVLGVTAPRASAAEVWYWGCQAPDGSQLAFNAQDPPNWFHTETGGG